MIIIGLTGQTGAGKTTVCAHLKERGLHIVDADAISRRIMENDTKYITALSAYFGKDIVDPGGGINRKKLGSMVFADKSKLEMLNRLSVAPIGAEIEKELELLRKEGADIVILDAPLLFEASADSYCTKTIAVIAESEQRLARVTARDGITSEEALNRIQSQHNDEFYIERSDYIISNGDDIPSLLARAENVIAKIQDEMRAY